MTTLSDYPLFDSHLHIIDERFPLQANNGYLPPNFNCNDYLTQMQNYNLCGGAVVSGSFQGYDQSYLMAALKQLGPSFVGVTQLPNSVSNDDIIQLHQAGVRALRFNLKRGGSEDIRFLTSMATRVHDIAGWHVELYVDSAFLPDLYSTLIKLPAVSIDHLGLTNHGFKTLLKLAEKDVKVKATGFGRVNFPVLCAIKDLYSANPNALMFGSDLPSTRAPIPFDNNDFLMLAEALQPEAAEKVFSKNALNFYQRNQSN